MSGIPKNTEAVLNEFREAEALLEGHFILTSGKRSPFYMQCARVLMDPARAGRLVAALIEKLTEIRVDVVVAPAMGGLIVGYELARQLQRPSIFAERVEGTFTFRRGFTLDPGARVLLAEDVVTTGLSLRECAECCRAAGAEVVGAACLIDRTGGKVDPGMPLWPLASIELPIYEADALPPELAAIPAVKPGSRGLV